MKTSYCEGGHCSGRGQSGVWEHTCSCCKSEAVEFYDVGLQSVVFIPAEFHDRIIKASLAWGHLVVTTASQCYVYKYVQSYSDPAFPF